MRPAPCSIYIPHVYDRAYFYRKDHFIFGGAFAFSRHMLVEIRCSPVPASLFNPARPRYGLRITDVKLLFFIPTPPGLGRTERSFPFPYAKRFSFTARRLLAPIFIVAGFLLHYLPYCGKGCVIPRPVHRLTLGDSTPTVDILSVSRLQN